MLCDLGSSARKWVYHGLGERGEIKLGLIPGSVPAAIELAASPLGRLSSTSAALFDASVRVRMRLSARKNDLGPHSVVIIVRPTGAPYFSVQCADWPPGRIRTWPIPGGLLRRSARISCAPIYVGNGVTYRDQVEFSIYAAAMDTAAAEGMFARLPRDPTGIPFFVEMFELKDFYPQSVFSAPAVVRVSWEELERTARKL